MISRINRLHERLKDTDVALITSSPNLFYLTGWMVSGMERFLALLTGPGLPSTLVVPRLEYDNALRSTTGIDVLSWQDEDIPYVLVQDLLEQHYGTVRPRILVEKPSLTVATYEHLATAVPTAEFADIAGLLSDMRHIKDAGEINALSRAAVLADQAATAGLEALAPGLEEYEIAGVIEAVLRSAGDRMTSFPPLVLSGPNGAYPHGRTGSRLLMPGDLVVMDLGGRIDGYCSDITRTGSIGAPGARARTIFDAVLAAQELAVRAVKPGIPASEVDRAAREYLENAGFGQYFVHRTGHGIGIEVHEAPYVGPRDTTVLQAGMVFSVEPGVYIPGWGGVRIEDIVTVTADGCRRLNHCSRQTLDY